MTLCLYKPLASNLIKFPLEIVSAEIKIDPQQSVVAFGQAVTYRLFSTKTYIAMPKTLTEEDQSRLESLCMLFGVGLVIFDLNKDAPQFSIRVRAQRFSLDMFYVNEFADRLKHLMRLRSKNCSDEPLLAVQTTYSGVVLLGGATCEPKNESIFFLMRSLHRE